MHINIDPNWRDALGNKERAEKIARELIGAIKSPSKLKESHKTDPTVVKADITCELWREYDFNGRTYRINAPVLLYTRPGGTTHRVVDNFGVAHCVPAPGQQGCVLRWKNRDGLDPVNF